MSRTTETMLSAVASDINRIDALIKEISLIVRDQSSKIDLLLDARTTEIPQASPARKPVGRGKVVKKNKVAEPEEDEQAEDAASETMPAKPSPILPAKPATLPPSKPVSRSANKASKAAAIDEPASDDAASADEYTVKKPAKKTGKPAAFNKLTAFTQAYKADPKRFNEYFTKQVRDDVDALPEIAGLTGDKLENARCRALYQTTVANYPEIFDELKADFNKLHSA